MIHQSLPTWYIKFTWFSHFDLCWPQWSMTANINKQKMKSIWIICMKSLRSINFPSWQLNVDELNWPLTSTINKNTSWASTYKIWVPSKFPSWHTEFTYFFSLTSANLKWPFDLQHKQKAYSTSIWSIHRLSLRSIQLLFWDIVCTSKASHTHYTLTTSWLQRLLHCNQYIV